MSSKSIGLLATRLYGSLRRLSSQEPGWTRWSPLSAIDALYHQPHRACHRSHRMPLFGGPAGQFGVLAARGQPSVRLYRVVPGQVWWTLMHWPWRQYRAAVAVGTPNISPPALAPPGAHGVYVTDRASLRGCNSPSDFAWRLSLSAWAQQECQLYGCAVISFDRPTPYALLPLPPLPGAAAGLTAGGAREWILAGNIDLADDMRVYYVERTALGSRYFRVPL
jgi:hypothetical protein